MLSRRAFLRGSAAALAGLAAAVTLPAPGAEAQPRPTTRAKELTIRITADTTQLRQALDEAEASSRWRQRHGLVEVGGDKPWWEFRCWVDGVEVTDDCFAANDIEGWADVYDRDADNLHFMDRQGDIARRRLRGDVVLVQGVPYGKARV